MKTKWVIISALAVSTVALIFVRKKINKAKQIGEVKTKTAEINADATMNPTLKTNAIVEESKKVLTQKQIEEIALEARRLCDISCNAKGGNIGGCLPVCVRDNIKRLTEEKINSL